MGRCVHYCNGQHLRHHRLPKNGMDSGMFIFVYLWSIICRCSLYFDLWTLQGTAGVANAILLLIICTTLALITVFSAIGIVERCKIQVIDFLKNGVFCVERWKWSDKRREFKHLYFYRVEASISLYLTFWEGRLAEQSDWFTHSDRSSTLSVLIFELKIL